ncbi:MAG: hypothetical protein KKB95_09495 [Gammaproteobacteria bacterium]|nr:hypothetical protein [Gammaproteobacteria bacterium]MBU1505795.1 hypothetical protein [Gammaproteobacteria bacterium]MBU2119483.1 hypothetical protein [Gammaproteobacteria bacterium]MBU2172611.1 hypothetical protein [Gammaproteobacteria bacterium]MBU2202069.1 hypothetical protein [Gammaproteobacteria bacterium]
MSAASTVAVAGLLVAIAAGIGGYGYGLDQGKALEKGHQDAQALDAITKQITAHADLVKRSGAASKGMRAATAQLEKANTQTTTEIADALTTTATDRVGCVFPAGVMRGLDEARARAAQAAASGVRGALPGAAASPTEPAGGPGSP